MVNKQELKWLRLDGKTITVFYNSAEKANKAINNALKKGSSQFYSSVVWTNYVQKSCEIVDLKNVFSIIPKNNHLVNFLHNDKHNAHLKFKSNPNL